MVFQGEAELEVEVQRIKRWLEKQYGVRLPGVEVRYSENTSYAFAVADTELPFGIHPETKKRFFRARNSELRLHGLKEDELEGVDPSKFTVFLPGRYLSYPVRLYGALWHELGHAAADALNVKDKVLKEGIAIACKFAGLLLEAKEERFTFEKAFSQIESDIAIATEPLSFFLPYQRALDIIKVYNLSLEFRNRNPDGLLGELEKSIQYAVKSDREMRRRELSRFEKPFVSILGGIALVLLAISLLHSFL